MEKEEIKQIHEQLESNNLSENNLEKLILLIEKRKKDLVNRIFYRE